MQQIKQVQQTLAQPNCRATAIRVALVVGTVLFTINHGSAFMNREMNSSRWTSGLLTYLVPFMVSLHGQSRCQRRPVNF